MIDKEQPLDVCKIEVRKLAEQKVKYNDVSMTKALKAISKEADIPFTTLKRWIYPKASENYNNRRKKSCITCDTKVVSQKNGDTKVVSQKNGDTTLDKILEQITVKELQDVVSKAAIVSKGIGADQSAAEIINLGLDIFSK